MRLTVNQLICFLEICRGTFNQSLKVGTREHDLNVLHKHDLIITTKGGFDYRTSEKGELFMSSLQNTINLHEV